MHLHPTATCTIASDHLPPTRRLRSLTPRHAKRRARCVSSVTCTLLSPEARVKHESSPTTVASVSCTGENSLTAAQSTELMMMELQPDDDDVSPKLQRKRTEPRHIEFQGPIIDVALIGAGLSSALFLAQNASSRHNFDTESKNISVAPTLCEMCR